MELKWISNAKTAKIPQMEGIIIGDPKATPAATVEELKGWGISGIYIDPQSPPSPERMADFHLAWQRRKYFFDKKG